MKAVAKPIRCLRILGYGATESCEVSPEELCKAPVGSPLPMDEQSWPQTRFNFLADGGLQAAAFHFARGFTEVVPWRAASLALQEALRSLGAEAYVWTRPHHGGSHDNLRSSWVADQGATMRDHWPVVLSVTVLVPFARAVADFGEADVAGQLLESFPLLRDARPEPVSREVRPPLPSQAAGFCFRVQGERFDVLGLLEEKRRAAQAAELRRRLEDTEAVAEAARLEAEELRAQLSALGA